MGTRELCGTRDTYFRDIISHSGFAYKSSFIIIEYSREIYFPSTEIPSINRLERVAAASALISATLTPVFRLSIELPDTTKAKRARAYVCTNIEERAFQIDANYQEISNRLKHTFEQNNQQD